jgi:ligand-binding sensor domain-containing protein
MRRVICVWFIGVFLCLGSVRAQPKEESVRFFHLTTKDGLSQSSVFAIAQDYLGFMWVGTRDGLNKYDARKFVTYRNILSDGTSLSDNYITSIFEDSKHRLWVGTAQGLNRYDRCFDRFQRISIIGNGHGEPIVSSIIEDTRGNLWFCTSQGLFSLPSDSINETPILVFNAKNIPGFEFPEGSRNVQHLYEDAKGRYWLSTVNGVYLFSFLAPTQKPIFSKSFRHAPGVLNNEDVRFVYEMKPGIYWFGTKEGGINVYDELNTSFRYLEANLIHGGSSLGSNDVRSIIKDRYEGYWIGTINGLSYYSESTGFLTFRKNDLDSYSLIDNSIRPIFQDHRGSIWVGTYYGGVSIFDRSLPLFRNYARNTSDQGLSYNVVSGILQDRNRNFWIGTEGGGLNYMTEDKKVLKKYRHHPKDFSSLSNNHVKSIYLDQAENLWVGTYTGGLNLLRKGEDGFTYFKNDPSDPNSISNNNVYTVKEDQIGNLWIGTYGGGLNVRKVGTKDYFEHYRPGKTPPFNLSSDLVRTVFIDSRENIWVGTEDGLNVKWADEDSFEQFRFSDKDPNSISGNVVISIYEDTKGRLWIGTFKNGLNEYVYADKIFRRIDEEDGLPGNNVFGIVENSGILWISTNRGICAFNVEDNQIKKYNIKDGLLGNEFSIGTVCKSHSGELLFGGSHGITAFYPEDIPSSAYYPKVVFTDFRIYNKSISPNEDGVLSAHISVKPHIVLNYRQNIFSVDFSTLNFVIPDKNKFAYRLEGLEEDWNYVATPTATYTNLAPGEYCLLIKGASNDGVWGAEPEQLFITILPPPWRTWWAYLLYAVFAAVTMWSIVRFTKSRSELKYQLYLKEIEAENERKVNEIKSSFFTNISHELRTPLTLILNPLHHMLSAMKSDYFNWSTNF